MAVTTLTLVNNVLRGLRQFGEVLASGTTTTTDDYIEFIVQLLNEAKEEVEESGWPWYALRNTVTITLSAGTAEYTLTSAGDADTDTNNRSQLLYESVETRTEGFRNNDRSLPQVFDVTDSGEYRLQEVSQEYIERLHFTDDDEQVETPDRFAIYQSGSSLKMKVYPTPSETRTIKARIYIPEDALLATSLDTSINLPSRPVWLRALYKANEERGSELGRPGSSLERAYQDAHGSAVGREQRPSDQTVTWEG